MVLSSPAEHVADELMPMVEADGVGALQPSHTGHQIWFRSLHYQVIVIGHKAVGMDLPVGFLASLSQGLDEILPVHIVEEDSLAPVAALIR